jgi:hypothetical protein
MKIIDNAFSLSDRLSLYDYIIKQDFYLGWPDTNNIEDGDKKYLHSNYTEEQVNKSKILEMVNGNEEIKNTLEGKQCVKCIVNLSIPTYSFRAHTHPGTTIVLCYVNLNWKNDWFGETVFYDNDDKEIIKSISYTPNRVVIFDGDTPHALRPQSAAAPDYRFTMALWYINK